MAKKNLLLVDADPKSVRVMEVSLRQAGFSVTTSPDGEDALEKVAINAPDMIIADTKLPGMDGFQFATRVKEDPRTAAIPFLFLSSHNDIEHKVKGLELGVDDYLTKPIYIKEILTRVRILMDKRDKETLERRDRSGFTGVLGEMGVVDLIQTVELGRKTGSINLTNKEQKGAIYFRNGKVIDAELGKLSGEKAFYRFLLWNEGVFSLDFGDAGRVDKIDVTSQGLLMEGMRRVDEWNRLLEQIPALGTCFEIDYQELSERLAEIPDEVNGILLLFDGGRTLMEVVDESPFGDLEALNIISKLYFEGLIFDTTTRESRPERNTTRILSWLDEPDPTPPPIPPPPSSNDSVPPIFTQTGPAESLSRVPVSTQPPVPPGLSQEPTVPLAASQPPPVTAPDSEPSKPGEEPVSLEDTSAPPAAHPAPPAITNADAARAVDALGAALDDDGSAPLPPLPPAEPSAAPKAAPKPRAITNVGAPFAGGRGRGSVAPEGSSSRLAPIGDRAPSTSRLPPPDTLGSGALPPIPPPAPQPAVSDAAAAPNPDRIKTLPLFEMAKLPAVPAAVAVVTAPAAPVASSAPSVVTPPATARVATMPTVPTPLTAELAREMEEEVTPITGLGAMPSTTPPAARPPPSSPPSSAPLAWALPAMTQAPNVPGGHPSGSGVMSTGEFEAALGKGGGSKGLIAVLLLVVLGGVAYGALRQPETQVTPVKPPVQPEPPVASTSTAAPASQEAASAMSGAAAVSAVAQPAPTQSSSQPALAAASSSLPAVAVAAAPSTSAAPAAAVQVAAVSRGAVEPPPSKASSAARVEAPPDPPPPRKDPPPPVKKDPPPAVDVAAPAPPAPAEDPKAFEKSVRRGKALVEQGNAKGAVTEFKKALTLKPGSAVAMAELGNAYFELGDNQAALKNLQAAAAADPNYAHAYVLLGAVYQGLNRAGEARGAYEKYLALEPNGKFAQDVKSILKALK
jgi:DNA-binding response OmpR family regulator